MKVRNHPGNINGRKGLKGRHNQLPRSKGLLPVFFFLLAMTGAVETVWELLTPPALAQTQSDRKAEADRLLQKGLQQARTSQYREAIQSWQSSLEIYRNIGDRQGEARSINNLGLAYSSLGQYPKAIEYYQQSLAIFKDLGDRQGEGLGLSNLGYLLSQQKQPQLAIIFYKQSVNVREAIRKDLRVLSPELQQSYTETVAASYRRLADLLLQQDRVLEAQQVLDLLKIQELDDYLKNVRGNNSTAQGIPNRPQEQKIKERLDTLQNEAIKQGKQLAQLETIKPVDRTEAQKQQILQLRKNQEQLAQQFEDFLKGPEVTKLVAELRQTTSGSNFDLDNAKSLQDNLKRLQQDAVILYPLVLEDRLELILVTPDTPPIRRTVQVKRDDLNRAILNFRNALRDRSSNATIPAQQLYQWLIKPIENDLTQAKAKTIIYAPDGQLRYIPLAALYDGTQWLTQRFRIDNITALSLTNIDTQPQSKLQVLAGAFENGHYSFKVGQESFDMDGLPFAAQEVGNLTKTIPGTTTRIDKKFTRDLSLEMNDYTVIHLATHAAFIVGQPEESFILFGNGDRVSFRDIEKWVLPKVDLVVLSACETGLGDIQKSNGVEILGFGYLMQKTGARATIASLWSVDDGGSQALMNSFYKALQQGKMTKAEALRQAQIALIGSTNPSSRQTRGSSIEIEAVNSGVAPGSVNRLSHPYYWAPFILIGNGL